MSTDVDGSIGCEHVNIDKNTQSSHADFNEGTQGVSISFIDHSPNNYGYLEDKLERLQITYDEIVDISDFNYKLKDIFLYRVFTKSLILFQY